MYSVVVLLVKPGNVTIWQNIAFLQREWANIKDIPLKHQQFDPKHLETLASEIKISTLYSF